MGGGVFLSAAAKLINCVFTGNTAYNGGAIYAQSPASIINCTITGNGNSSGGSGAGIYNSGANLIITNTISWANTNFGTTADGFYSSGGSPVITYSNIHSGVSGYVYPGTGNKNEDPLFINSADADGADNIWGTADDGLRLVSNSPSTDKGNNTVVVGVATDITGAARIQNATVNMGAYETVMQAQVISGLPATATKTYGDVAYTLSATGGGSGNPIVYTSSNTAVATISGNTVTIVGAGTTTITANQAGNSSYAPAAAVTQTLTVNKKTITVTADAKSKVYGDLDPALVGSDAFTGSLKRDIGETVGMYTIRQNTLALNSNYTLSYSSANFSITKRAITVTADAVSKVYGDTDPSLTYTITSGSLKSGDAFSGSLLRDPGVDAGTYAIKQGSLALNSNYNLTFISNNLTIDKRAITVTAEAKSKVYGDADPDLTYKITAGSLVGIDELYGYLIRAVGGDVGTYAINQGTLDNPNYAITFVGADLAISQRAITIKANDASKTVDIVASNALGISASNYAITYNNGTLTVNVKATPALAFAATATKTYGDGDFAPGATSTNPAPITYTSSDNSVATIVGGQVHIVKAGTVTITASQAEDASYTAVSQSQTLTINKAPLTITADDKTKIQGSSNPVLTVSFSGFVLGENSNDLTAQPVLSTTATASSPAGTYPITVSGAASDNYTITYVNGTLTVNACTATTITTQPVAQAKCAGETVTFEVVASGTGLTYQWMKGASPISGATDATLTITGVTAANAGDYSVVVTGACGTVTSNVASLTVNAVAVPTITAAGNMLTSSATTGNQWYREGAEISGATAQTYQAQAAGRYTVKVTSGSCSATSSEFNFVPTRIDEPSAWNGAVIAYPNPVGKILYVKNNSGRKLQLQLVDVAGVKVWTSTLVGTQGSINVEGLAAGAYYLVVTDQQTQQSISIKLIKL